MDRSKFTAKSPGQLVRIAKPQPDWAFIPNDLPVVWKFDDRLWPLLAHAKQVLGTLDGIGQTLAEPMLLLRPLQRREAITSSSIEGTVVTPAQLMMYELNPREPESPDDKLSDWMEVFNYKEALLHGCQLLNELPICNRVIREVHRVLMSGARGRAGHPGEFRRWQVQIGDSGRYLPPPAVEVERLMKNLEASINDAIPDEGPEHDPLVRAFLVHYQFEAIHPFVDGNGRVGRLLLSLMIQKWMGHTSPWLYLSAFFERYRREYMRLLFNISAEGDWTTWVEFCLRGTIHQAIDSIRRCREFKSLKDSFHARVNHPSKRTHRIIDGLFMNPMVTPATLAEQFGITYPTAATDIGKLVKVGILSEVEGSYPRTFCCNEIFDVAYGEGEPTDETGAESSEAPISFRQAQPANAQ
jgi:Fic family protein